jgi:hypothetical protein
VTNARSNAGTHLINSVVAIPERLKTALWRRSDAVRSLQGEKNIIGLLLTLARARSVGKLEQTLVAEEPT